nr:tumor necrosis factor receptor superfamily member 25 isoform X3 [Pipistrellus kuhlii]
MPTQEPAAPVSQALLLLLLGAQGRGGTASPRCECARGSQRRTGPLCCRGCPAGQYLAAPCTEPCGNATCAPCGQGSFLAGEHHQQTSCTRCQACDEQASQVALENCSAVADTRCGCPPGWFAECPGPHCISGLPFRCHPCLDCGALHRHTRVPCSSTDTECGACLPGFYEHGNSCVSCPTSALWRCPEPCAAACGWRQSRWRAGDTAGGRAGEGPGQLGGGYTQHPPTALSVFWVQVLLAGLVVPLVLGATLTYTYRRCQPCKPVVPADGAGMGALTALQTTHLLPPESAHILLVPPSGSEKACPGQLVGSGWTPGCAQTQDAPGAEGPWSWERLRSGALGPPPPPAPPAGSAAATLQLGPQLYDVVDAVPARRWKEFVRTLGLREAEIEAVEVEVGRFRDQQYEMLKRWRQQQPAGLGAIYAALERMGLDGCAEDLRGRLQRGP